VSDNQKLEKNLQLTFFLYQKLQLTYTSIKDVQATEEAFSPKKRKSSTSKITAKTIDSAQKQ
jgi:hypothetical protein